MEFQNNSAVQLRFSQQANPPYQLTDSMDYLQAELKKPQFTFWDNFRRMQWAITRRAWIVVLIFILTLSGTVIFLRNQPNVYQAFGALKVKPRVQNIVGNPVDVMNPRFFATTWEELQSGPATTRAFRQVQHLIKPNEKQPIWELDVIMPRVSDIYRVYVRSDNPEFAKEYLNALFSEFIRYKKEEITDVSRNEIDKYTRELVNKMDELRQAEDRLFEFRRLNPEIYIEDETQSIMEQRNQLDKKIKEIDTQIKLLEELKEFFYKSTSARSTVEQFRFSGGDYDIKEIEKTIAATEWINAKSEFDRIDTELQNLKKWFKDRHPVIRDKQEQFRLASKRLQQATENSELEFNQRIEELRRQKNVFEEQKQKLTVETIDQAQRRSEHDRLIKEVERLRGLYNNMAAELEKITVGVDTAQDLVSIWIPAEVGTKPVRPKKMQVLIGASIVSLIIGCGLVLLIDRVLNKVSSPEQVEAELGLDLLGVVPKLTIPVRKPEKGIFTKNPDIFGFAESFRTLRSVLIQLRSRTPMQVLQITSPQPNDGKSFISINLALAMSQGGGTVLLIGADLRRPSLHKPLGIANETGLSEVLQGLKDWRTQIKNTGYDNLHFLPSGQSPLDPSRLLHTSEMRSLMIEVRQHYDWIIVDCPPLVAVSDAIVVAPLSDATILVIRSESTPLRLAQVAVSILNKRAKHPIGAILNALDLQRGYYPSYGYYRYQDSGYSYANELDAEDVFVQEKERDLYSPKTSSEKKLKNKQKHKTYVNHLEM